MILYAYNNPDKSIFIDAVCCDKNNNIHCVGGYYNYQPPHDYGVIYFQYFPSSNQWSQIEYLSPITFRNGNDIDVDTNNTPHVSWSQNTQGLPNQDSTIYRYRNGSGIWSDPSVITPAGREQQIVIDKYNKPNIIEVERTDSGVKLVHFYKFPDQWIGNIIAETNCGVGWPNLISANNKLYLVFIQCVDNNADIVFSKCDVVSVIEKQRDLPVSFSIFPNPIKSSANIVFSLRYCSLVIISIYSSDGKLMECIANREYQPGTYSILWNTEQGN